jgi:hypothetical protein
MLRQLYLWKRNPQYPFSRRLGGSQSLFGHGVKEKKIPVSARNQTPVVQPIT